MNTPKIILTAMLWVVSFTAFSQTVSQEFYFLESEFQAMIVDDFTAITCLSNDYYLKEEPGKPALPVRSIKLMIPSDAKYLSHSIKERVVPYLEECTVFPMQPPVPTDGTIAHWVKPDSSIYDGDGVFPKEKSQFSGMHIMGNYRIITIEYCPFKYYPKENRVELVSRLDLTIELERDQKPQSRYENEMHFKMVESIVDNPQDVTYTSGRSPVNPNDVKYLIITDANMIDDFQPLADWKTQKGVPAEVISIQSVLANYTGATDQLKIKTCLQDYYMNKGLQWVLLGGDNTIVPDQDCYGIVNANSSTPSIDNTIPTDLFYCCFDNAFDWNADGDNQVGEVEDNVDMAPEIFIGRAPVQTNAEAMVFVNKTINYIQTPPSNNFAKKFVSSGLQLWNTWGGHSDADWRSEAMWNEVIAPIWTGTKYKYYDTDTDFPGGEYYDVTQQNTVDILSDGYNIFWMATHGGQQAWGMESGDGFYSSSASSLTNYMRQGLVVTMACNTNAFETSVYGNDPCLSEAFLRNGNGGAVMYHGSSRYGWGNGSAVLNHGSSMEYARDFFYALFSGTSSSNPQAFAAVSAESKLDNIGNASAANSFRWLMFAINNMGDPELPILTQNPSNFVASMPAYLLYGVSQNVVVSTGVPGALVCVMDTNVVTPVYAYGYADSNGDCTLQVTPNQDYPLTVTISATNFHPSISTINTISPSDPFVVVDEIIPSTTNGDSMLEAGETAYFDVRIINVGGVTANNIVMQLAKTDPDNFITLTDSNETVTQSLPSGDTLVVAAAFSLDVAMDATNNYGITLSTGISFSSKDMTWYPQDFTVYSYIDPVFLTAISGNQRVDLSWRAPFGGWKSYYNGGGWLTSQKSQRAMLYNAADFDLSYPMEISRIASSFYESDSWGESNTFRYNIYDASTEELIYQTDWIVANSYGYTFHNLDYPITLTNDFYLAVEVSDLINGYPVSVISEPMEPEDTHCYVGSPGNWTKWGFECSSYIYVMDAGSTVTKELSYQQNQLSQQNPAPDLTLGKGPKFSFQGYNVYRDDVKINNTLITDNSYTDQPLLTDLYSYYVTAVYGEGESCASNEVIAASLDANTVFYDHFDGTSFWTCDDDCSWNTTSNDYYSATASYTDSPDGNYQHNMDCSTWTATPVNLMNVNAELATVSFYAKYAIEEDFDSCFFEIATDLNGSREVLGSFTGINNVWTEYPFDISNYIGNEAVYFIFRMNTDEMVSDDGIYIDDFLVTVSENGFSPARNIEANLYDMDVHLSWSPPMAGGEGWFSHWRWNTHYTISADEKGAYINLAEFGNAYPMMLTKIRHHFYDPANNNWNGNNRFTFRIYNTNGMDLVYESPQIEAVAWLNEYTLPVPFELTDDVLIAVAPVSSSGGPYSLTQHDFGNTSRSYIGDATMGWSNTNGNWATEIYITNSSKSNNALWSQSGVALQNVNSSLVDMAMLPVPAEDLKKAPRFIGNQNLVKNVQGYNVFRNGSQRNGALVTDTWFMDDLPYQGQYSYTVKAVYSGGESVESMPQFIELDDVVVMIPPLASAFDEVTLWFDPAYSCEAGSGSSLENFGEVWMHSGIGINGTIWNNSVPWDNLGANGQSPQMVLNGNGKASITYTPSEFYGTSADQSLQDQLCMVLNGGNLAQAQFGSPWSKIGKATDEYGNCTDIFIPLEYRDTLFMDDFESGISKWSVTGDWTLCEAEFFSPTHSLTDSPDGNYSSPSDTYAAMANPVDLSQKAHIVLEFKTLFGLNENDFVYVEISTDDFVSSEVVYTFSYNNWKPWDKVQIGLDDYSGFDNVKIRFHMVVQNMETNDGILIDDVLIKATDGCFIITDLIPHTTDGDGDFEANESGTLDVVIVNGGALSLSNVPLTLSKTDADGYITITDNVCTIESLNPGERDTIFDAFSLDVAIGVTDSYPFTLSVGADIPTEDMQWFEFGFFAYSNIYPLNLVAENGSNEVSLSWLAPFRGWYSYQNGGIQGTHLSEEERATLIQASDFDLTYPLYFNRIAHRFLENPENPWNGNNTFRYNLYDYAAGTILYQSDWMQAPEDGYAYLNFNEPMLVNGDFFISVEVQDAGNSNFPSSCRNDGTTYPQSHSYLGSPDNWISYPHEWITYLFITGDGGVNGTGDNLAVGYENGSPVSGISEDFLPQEGKSGNAKSDIIGFNIYRDGAKINEDQPIDGYSYLDGDLPLGAYLYQATAVYSDGESCFSNSATGTSINPDIVFFEDFEGYNEEDWNCGWGFTEVDSHSSSHSLANGPNGNYDDNQDCYVKVDPPVHLLNINADSAVLSFWAKYEIEENVDTCFLEVTSDFWGGEHVQIGYFTGTNTSWQEYSFDVSNFIGKSLVYIFRMKTNESINFDGIYIDDVSVRVYGNDNAPARNFEAFAYGADVHLEWGIPMAGGEGWFSNWRWTTAYTVNNTEMASYFDLAEFGNPYPMTLERINHYFYDFNGDNWGGQDQYNIKIYEKDGTTVLFESGNLTAHNGPNEFILPTPLQLTDDILISIVPATNYPSSCLMNDVNNPSHGYMGNFDEGWTSINGNFATEIYVTYPGAKSAQGKYWGTSGVELGNLCDDISDNTGIISIPADVQATLPQFKGITSLAKNVSGYNVYRNGNQINTDPVTNSYYYDTVPHQGVYDYYVKALYAGGESVGTVNKIFVVDDVVLMFPMDATPNEELTLWFDPYYSCESGGSNSLEGSAEVRIHSGVGLNGTAWNNTVQWDQTGYDGTTTYLTAQPGGQYTFTYTPTAFYGVDSDSDIVDHLDMVFNSGNSTASPWDKTGKSSDGSGGCIDIVKGLNYRAVIFEDDFESGLDNWTLTGSWGLSDSEFYTATHSLSDSPYNWYWGQSETSATMANGVSLVGYVHILLEFNFMHGLGSGDEVLCEISTNDFQSYDVLATYTYWDWKPWKRASISLESYKDNTNVKIRFRLVTNESEDGDGVYVDDFTIKGYYDETLIETIPYNQDFTFYPTPDWDMYTGQLTANSTLIPYSVTGMYDGWHEDGFGCNGGTTGAIRGNIWSSNHYFWYNTPFINLGENPQNLVLRFDMAGNLFNSCNMATLGIEDIFAVVISTDGVTWSDANTLIQWGQGDTFPVNGETYQVNLTGYSGTVKFGFYHGHNSSNTDIEVFVDNVYVGIDDSPPITIAEARTKPIGSVVCVEGIVTNDAELGNIRYFQDETGGIAAYGSIQADSIYRGDRVIYRGQLTDYYELLELSPLYAINKQASGQPLPTPENVEPSQFGEPLESHLITIDTAYFISINYWSSFNNWEHTAYEFVTPSHDTAVVFVRTTTNLAGQYIPHCPVALTGILSQYTNDPYGGYRVMMRDTLDYENLSIPASNITATAVTNDVTLSWDSPIPGHNMPGVDYYRIYRNTSGVFSEDDFLGSYTNPTSVEFSDQESGTYYYWVKTDYCQSPAALSEPVSVTVDYNFIISGFVTDTETGLGLADVEMQFLTGAFPSVYTDASGYYQATVPGETYIYMKPILDCYNFSPNNYRNYFGLTGDVVVDFSATLENVTIRGSVNDITGPGIDDVYVHFITEGTLDTVTRQTNPWGSYSNYSVPCGWNGWIVPEREHYFFNPDSIIVNDVIEELYDQNFVAECDTGLLVSGVVSDDDIPLEGVAIAFYGGFAIVDTVYTNAQGYYEQTVPFDWDGYVRPLKDDYDFDPNYLVYHRGIEQDMPDQDFEANYVPIDITGVVTCNGSPLQDVQIRVDYSTEAVGDYTDENGFFHVKAPIGYSGFITPRELGYAFEPDTIFYHNLMADIGNQDFNAFSSHHTVSGTVTTGGVGFEGVQISFPMEGSTYTDAQGNYAYQVPHGYDWNIRASKEYYRFEPNYIDLGSVLADTAGNDFTGFHCPHKITGTVILEGAPFESVFMYADNGAISGSTDENGNYTVYVPEGWSGTIEPGEYGYGFTPESIPYSNVTGDITDQDYTAYEILEYTISGTILDYSSASMAGVTVQLTNTTQSTTTASDGTYSFTAETGYTGQIIPSMADYTFDPTSRNINFLNSHLVDQNFTGAPEMIPVSGIVSCNGQPLEGVLLNFENITNNPVTASDGFYSCDVPYNWSGTVTPSKAGYTFDPENRIYTNVVAEIPNQDYEAYSVGLPPGWGYVNTGSNHTLFVQATAPMIDGEPLSYDSWIGVFYLHNGVEKCGGAINWQGPDSPIIAAYGDDPTTPEKDGFSEGETIIYKFYTNDVKGTEMYATATYSSGPEIYSTNGSSVIPLLQASTSMTHTVQLPEGWSGVSSYIVPDNDSTSVIFAPVLDDFIILKNMTQAYWPPYSNQIVHWNPYEGYKIKLNAAGEVNFVGGDTEKTLTLDEGWCLLPVLTNYNVDATAFFAPVIENLIIAKTIDGMGVYWPAVGVQTLLSLAPGESYMVKFSSQSTLSYPQLATKSSTNVKGYPNPVVCDVWESPTNTGNTHVMAFSDDLSQVLENGDFVGVFDINDRCVGLSEFSDTAKLMIPVYGDDPTSPEKDGLFYDEAFVVKMYNPTSNEIIELLLEYDQNLDGAYRDNGLTLVTKTTVVTTGIGSLNPRFTKVYPNPTSNIIYVYVPGSETISLTARVIAPNGGAILSEVEFNGLCAINVHSLPAGVYLIQISDEVNEPVYRRFIKK